VRGHRFWTDARASYALHAVDGEVLCVVPGTAGTLLSGRIEAREPWGARAAGTRASAPIRVTIGAMVPWSPVWLP
jgi:hypothetical protein